MALLATPADTSAIRERERSFCPRRFPQHMDGEFAAVVVDAREDAQRLVVSTDVFGTKPVWISRHEGLHVSTCRDERGRGLQRLLHQIPDCILLGGQSV